MSTLREARLVSARLLSANVRELTIDPGPAFTFVPGQWVNLRVPGPEGAAPLVRAYSIASPPRADGTYDVAVTRVEGGPMSTWLHGLQPGASLVQSHAQGFFTLPMVQRPLLFVATGTGISPIRSMLLSPELTEDAPIALLFGNRTAADILYRDDFERLAATRKGFVFAPTLSRADAGWTGRTGYVQTHLREVVAALGGDCDAFVCGLQRMVGDVRNVLRKELGLERGRVHTERYD